MNINVTKPFLPDFDVYMTYIMDIWKREWLTNNGPLVNELELRLKDYLNVEHMLYVSNGTTALQLAIKALDLTGDIITTPFSFVATTSSIVWQQCRPVMVDIEPDTLNIDASKIEAAITPETTAILATHIYGNPCDVRAIEDIAKRHDLKVIYDAAHAFGTTVDGRSIFTWGDISITSFHATKLFHTIEGGGIFTRDPDVLRRIALLRNFGFVNTETIDGVGINGKNCEFHAAMGLANLPNVDAILARRRTLSTYYDEKLAAAPLKRPAIKIRCNYNHAYYPVLFQDEATLLRVSEQLRLHNVTARRYFYPSLSTLNYVGKQSTPIAEDASRRILALPMYHGLSLSEIDLITRVILRTFRYQSGDANELLLAN